MCNHPDHHDTMSLATHEALGLSVRFEIAKPGSDGRLIEDGFEIVRHDDDWLIRSQNGRSCLWGVYHLKGGGGPGVYRPRFAVRGLNVCETLARHSSEQVADLIDRAARWRMNRLVIHHAYGYRRHAETIRRLCTERGIELVHYLQSSVLFLREASADLFARDESGLPRTPDMQSETRLCPHHPGARESLRRGALRYFQSDAVEPGSRLIVIDADGYLFCRCPACQKTSPAEQWAILFELIQDAADAADKSLAVHYLAYVWRYSLPSRPRIMQRLDGVLFDTHQRLRWRPIGQTHPLTHYNRLESEGDSRAARTPLNVYLQERLEDWREACPGEVCVFENLMLHGSISCPQPYTPQLLADLDNYQRLGIDGVIYEAFEPGIDSFAEQLGTLGRAMWHDATPYPATALERACEDLTEGDNTRFDFKNCFNVLSYLTTEKFDGLALARRHQDDPVLSTYLERLQRFLHDRTHDGLNSVLEYVMAHRDRFDWMFIAFNLARAAQPPLADAVDDAEARAFLTVDKLHDWLEDEPEPTVLVERVIRALIDTPSITLK